MTIELNGQMYRWTGTEWVIDLEAPDPRGVSVFEQPSND